MSIGNDIDDAYNDIVNSVDRMPWSDDSKESVKDIVQEHYDSLTGYFDFVTMYGTDAEDFAELWSDVYLGYGLGIDDDAFAVRVTKFWQAVYDSMLSSDYDSLTNIDSFRSYLASGAQTAYESQEQGMSDVMGAIEDTINDAKDKGTNLVGIALVIATIFGLISILK